MYIYICSFVVVSLTSSPFSFLILYNRCIHVFTMKIFEQDLFIKKFMSLSVVSATALYVSSIITNTFITNTRIKIGYAKRAHRLQKTDMSHARIKKANKEQS